jgi:N-dimethylarginine dimethylaminohydrolase
MDQRNTSVKCHAEWHPLSEVIVGRADGARIPPHDRSLKAINYANMDIPVPEGLYPEQVIEETNEDLERFVKVLEDRNITVHRPTAEHMDENSYYVYCPRDSFTTIGDKIIETPMPLRARYYENFAYQKLFIDKMLQGANWISAPKQQVPDTLYRTEDIDRDTLTLTEQEPCFDAANVLKCGKDILYLVSNSGNKLGAQWLKNVLGSEYRLHLLENTYSYMHLDSTISLIRPGLVLLNPSRINSNNLPDIFKGWDLIYSEENTDIGHYPGYCNSSVWIGMNLLMLDEKTAVVEEHQTNVIRQLEAKGIDVCALPLRHSRTLGGGFHCITNDMYREGTLESYV